MSIGNSVLKAGAALAKTGSSAAVNVENSAVSAGAALAKTGSSAAVNAGSSAAVSAENSAPKAGKLKLVNSENAPLIKSGCAVQPGFQCRQTFEIPNSALNYHPGHMAKGMRKMQGHLARVDCVLEIHDARIPFSGRNPAFYNKLTAIRPHILVLNKCDLAERMDREEIREILLRNDPNLAEVVYTNSKIEHHQSIKSIMPTITDAIERRAIHNLKNERYFMCIGVPNSGKSSLINAMRRTFVRKSKACPVADHAGVTRAVQERVKLMDWPPTYCYDTPGITQPAIPDVETGMRLAAVSSFKDSNVGLDNIVDYLLYFMNKRSMFQYVSAFGLEEPTDDVYILLISIAKSLEMTIKTRVFTSAGGVRLRYDTHRAAMYFLDQYRRGNLGTFILDDDKLLEERTKHSNLRLPPGQRPLAIDSGRLAIDSGRRR